MKNVSANNNTDKLICGHTWEAIQRAQQGQKLHETLPPVDPVKAKTQIESDILKFKMPVYREVAEAYGVAIPSDYVLQGDMYVYQPQPETI